MRLSRSFALPPRPLARTDMRSTDRLRRSETVSIVALRGAFCCWTGVGCQAKTVPLSGELPGATWR
jgi:hypothetical protein